MHTIDTNLFTTEFSAVILQVCQDGPIALIITFFELKSRRF